MPSLVVIAGPNGSGKSTLYRRICQKIPSFCELPFVNPDEIAKELFASYLSEDSSAYRARMITAGKKALKTRNDLLSRQKDFGFETTLSGHSEIRFIQKAYSLGYRITLIYVGLNNPMLSIARVKSRMLDGGHFVAPEDIIRRWSRSENNLIELRSFAHRIYLIDNSYDCHHVVAKVRQIAAKKWKSTLYPSANIQVAPWFNAFFNALSNDARHST